MSNHRSSSDSGLLLYLLESGLLESGGGRTDGMERGRGRVDEVEELVRGLGASLGHHGHGAEGRGKSRTSGYMHGID